MILRLSARISRILLITLALLSTAEAKAYDVEIQLEEALINRFAQSVRAQGKAGTADAKVREIMWRIADPGFSVSAQGIRFRGKLTATVVFNNLQGLQTLPNADGVRIRVKGSTTRMVYSQPFDLPAVVHASGSQVQLRVATVFVSVLDGSGAVLARTRPAQYFDADLPLNVEPQRVGGARITPSFRNVMATTVDGAIRVRCDIRF